MLSLSILQCKVKITSILVSSRLEWFGKKPENMICRFTIFAKDQPSPFSVSPSAR